MGKTCEICGANSGMYPICMKCLKLKEKGKVTKCEKCGTWHYTDKPCKCEPEQKENIIEHKEEQRKSDCILCGKEANGYNFCKECYAKYKDKTITVNIKNCESFEIIDEYGNKIFKNDAGMYVRSQQETIISNELFKRGIRFIYEKTFKYLDDNNEIKELHPDFYLPDYDLIIEHWGYLDTNDPDYARTKSYKEKIYKSLNKNVAGTTSKDIQDISAAIDTILLLNPKIH